MLIPENQKKRQRLQVISRLLCRSDTDKVYRMKQNLTIYFRKAVPEVFVSPYMEMPDRTSLQLLHPQNIPEV